MPRRLTELERKRYTFKRLVPLGWSVRTFVKLCRPYLKQDSPDGWIAAGREFRKRFQLTRVRR